MDAINQLFRINSAIGISLTMQKDGGLVVNACQIEKQGNKLDFQQKAARMQSLDELSQRFDSKVPVSLNLSGKGVLTRKIEKVDEISAANFAQILPNADIEDFYVQNFVSGELSFVSIIRKSEADEWLSKLKELGFNVVMFNIGAFASGNILSQLNFYDADLVFGGHVITRNEQKHWMAYQYDETAQSPFPLKIESEKIDEHLVLAYASAFQLVMAGRIESVQAHSMTVAEQYQQTLSAKWIKGYGTLAVFMVFCLLLFNFVLFSWLSSENTRLSYQVGISSQNTSDSKAIAEKISEKERVIKALGWNGGVRKAYLVDQLASILPEEIVWNEIALSPIDTKGNPDQKDPVFRDDKIRITGTSAQIIPVNEWMARIKTRGWVKSVTLESYNFNQELSTGQFTIMIAY